GQSPEGHHSISLQLLSACPGFPIAGSRNSWQLLDRATQRLAGDLHLRPQVAYSSDAACYPSQRKRSGAHLAVFNLVPGAWRGYGRARPGAHGVRGRKRCAVSVASGVHQDTASAVGLLEFLCKVFRITAHEYRSDCVCEPPDVAEAGCAVERHNDVEAL